jgi:glycosyltransferase involved in cell wall biosynthesis
VKIFAGHDGGSGCSFYRIELPLREMAKHGHDVTFADAGDRNHPPVVTLDMLRGYDVVVAQRWNKHDGLGTWRRASLWAKTVYELDDDLWHITAENWNAYQHYNQPEIRDATTHAAETASLVTVSTEPLAATVREEAGHDRVAVLPNCIPEWVTLLPRPRRDRPRVGWQGGASHGIDIGQVAGPVRRFLKRFPNWDLQLNGADYRHTFRVPADRAFFTGWVPIQEEPDKYYASVDFDIGLAPLWPTQFSAAKSAIKVIEYGARGIPSIASDCPAYRDVITDGVDGFLVKHDHEWLKYLSVLASDDALREKMGAAAVEMARRHLIEDGWTNWRDAYEIMFRLHWPHCLLSGSQVVKTGTPASETPVSGTRPGSRRVRAVCWDTPRGDCGVLATRPGPRDATGLRAVRDPARPGMLLSRG